MNCNYTQSETDFYTLVDQYDFQNRDAASIPFRSKEDYFTVGAGLLVAAEKYFLGFSVDNFNSLKEAE